MKSYLKYLLIVGIIFLIHFMILKPILKLTDRKSVSHIEASVMQEKIEKVLKLVTVEGTYSEILDFSDYNMLNLPGFRKKALIKTVSTAAAGIDLEKLKIEFDENSKTLTIENLPEFEILYVNSKYTYYDLTEGIFNNFNESELNRINTIADSIMLKKIQNSNLLERAQEQGSELMVMLESICQTNGWKLEISNEKPTIIQKTG